MVKDVRVSTQFPHGLRIRVLEQLPVGALVAGGQRSRSPATERCCTSRDGVRCRRSRCACCRAARRSPPRPHARARAALRHTPSDPRADRAGHRRARPTASSPSFARARASTSATGPTWREMGRGHRGAGRPELGRSAATSTSPIPAPAAAGASRQAPGAPGSPARRRRDSAARRGDHGRRHGPGACDASTPAPRADLHRRRLNLKSRLRPQIAATLGRSSRVRRSATTLRTGPFR